MTSRDGTAATFSVTIDAGVTTQAAVLSAIQGTTATVNGVSGTRLNSLIDVTDDGSGHLQFTAKNSAVDFTIEDSAGGSNATTLTELGLTGAEAGAANNSSSLLDQLGGATAQGTTLTISGNNASGSAFTSQTLTFGTGSGEISTLDELNTALGNAATASGGFSANASTTKAGTNITGAISITKAGADKASVTVGGTLSTLTAASTTLETTAGDVFSTHNSQPTLADLGTGLSGGGSLSFTVNDKAYTVGINGTDRLDDVLSKLIVLRPRLEARLQQDDGRLGPRAHQDRRQGLLGRLHGQREHDLGGPRPHLRRLDLVGQQLDEPARPARHRLRRRGQRLRQDPDGRGQRRRHPDDHVRQG